MYEKSLALLLTERGLSVKCQYPIPVYFRGVLVGDYYADLFVDDKVIVEPKAINKLVPEHQAQLIHYLAATRTEVGLLINFGRSQLEYKRLRRAQLVDNPDSPDEL